jgi:hypothetical protein
MDGVAELGVGRLERNRNGHTAVTYVIIEKEFGEDL